MSSQNLPVQSGGHDPTRDPTKPSDHSDPAELDLGVAREKRDRHKESNDPYDDHDSEHARSLVHSITSRSFLIGFPPSRLNYPPYQNQFQGLYPHHAERFAENLILQTV